MLRAEGTYVPCLKTGDSNKDEKVSRAKRLALLFYFLFRINSGAVNTRFGQGRAILYESRIHYSSKFQAI